MQEIVILGAGGLAREIAFLLEEINRAAPTWQILGFVEADERKVGARIGRYEVICVEKDLFGMEVAAVIGIGNPVIIQKIAARFKDHSGVTFPNLVHPNTIWDQERISMGRGNVICAGNIFTTDIQIGSFNCFNLSCTCGHDVEIGDYCVFNPGIKLSGAVKIAPGCLVGTGATILQDIAIGKGAIIGAGAVVTKDVQPDTTVVGIPARPLKKM